MAFLLLQLLHGAAAGALYGLLGIAVGLLMRGNVPANPALGGVATLAGLLAASAANQFSLPFLLLLPWGMLIGGLLAAAIELTCIATLGRPGVLRHMPFAPGITVIAAWVGAEAAASLVAGPAGIRMPADSFPSLVFGSGELIVRLIDLLVLLVAIPGAIGIGMLLRRTPFGLALSAIRFDAVAAAIGGVNPRRVLLLASVLAGGIAGAAGVAAACMAAIASAPATATLGQSLVWNGIAALVLSTHSARVSRMQPIPILAVGLLLGILGALIDIYVPRWMPLVPWQGAAAAMLLAVLLLRPFGLLRAYVPAALR